MKDVYGGDDATPAREAGFVLTFVIDADPDPDVISRIAQTLALANRIPESFTLRNHADADAVTVTTRLRTVDATQADYIRRKMQQLTSVRRVVALD